MPEHRGVADRNTTDSPTRAARRQWIRAIVAAGAVAACSDGSTGEPLPPTTMGPSTDVLPTLSCAVSSEVIFSGGPGRDGIPALVNPTWVALDHPDAQYVDRYAITAAADPGAVEPLVVGLTIDDVPYAIPHNIMWWHEIVNADIGGRRLAITYCPLTGSALAFDITQQTTRLGVSGVIFQNNLVMFDEETGSLWPQMCRAAELGDRDGTPLVQVPTTEMRWEVWTARHPNSLVISEQTGFDREYDRYPYNGYEISDFVLFPLPRDVDRRRPMKERVLGVVADDGGMAFPFSDLASSGPVNAIAIVVGTREIVVLWDDEAQSAAAFLPQTTDGVTVTIRPKGTAFEDIETQSGWTVEGRAVSGPLAGSTLQPHPASYIAYWFAWSGFHPRTRVWSSE